MCLFSSDGVANVTKGETKKPGIRGKTTFGKDRRRKHHHYLVSVFYADGEKFGRVYTDKDKATRFAERQRGSRKFPDHSCLLTIWFQASWYGEGLWQHCGHAIKRR